MLVPFGLSLECEREKEARSIGLRHSSERFRISSVFYKWHRAFRVSTGKVPSGLAQLSYQKRCCGWIEEPHEESVLSKEREKCHALGRRRIFWIVAGNGWINKTPILKWHDSSAN
jgi:hypothetical protein